MRDQPIQSRVIQVTHAQKSQQKNMRVTLVSTVLREATSQLTAQQVTSAQLTEPINTRSVPTEPTAHRTYQRHSLVQPARLALGELTTMI